ncbi:MAG: DHA2 family efflux MFS transporter permease subunit [Alphaproteobacteria bacterium]|nr:DHA2 family efflux MFS transporter permease subunit [Alphaproteobacteria bacterium]
MTAASAAAGHLTVAHPAHMKRDRMIITVSAMMATLMQALDNTIANVALPHMQGSLSATSDQITWVLTSYIVAAAIFTAPVGWLAGRFGRKNFFVATLVGFTVASMLCGVAETLPEMVLFRALQGMCGAALVPLSQTTMFDLYPVEQRGSAMAAWGMGVMIGPIMGPTLGGYLTDMYNWRWVFYVNVPFGILAVSGLWFFMKDEGRNAGLKFDWLGFAVLSLGLGAFQLFLDRGEGQDWFGSTEIIIEAVLASLGIYLFVVHMFTAKAPFITPRIFTDRNFLGGFFMMFTMGLVLLSSSALLPPYLQNLGNYSVTDAGLLMAPRGVGTMIAMMIAGRLSSRMDPRLLMFGGIIMMTVAVWFMTGWTPDVDGRSIVAATMLQGFGMGFVFIPLQVVAFATLDPKYRTDGAALFSLMRNIGSAIGISVSVLLLTQSTATMHSQLADQITPFNRALEVGATGLFMNPHVPMGLAALNALITRQSSIIAYSNVFEAMLFAGLPAALALLLMRRPPANAMRPPAEDAEAAAAMVE